MQRMHFFPCGFSRRSFPPRRLLLLLFVSLSMVIATSVIFLGRAGASTQATYYIAPNGSNSNNGTSSSTPFATIDHARQVIRTVNSNMSGDIVVYLRGGTYTLNSTVTFAGADSGTNGYNILYKAYPGETPVISGGTTITGWNLYDSSKQIWSASVPSGLNFRQMWVNGQRAARTRTTGGIPGIQTTSTGYTTSDTTMHNWQNQSDIELVYDVHTYSSIRIPVQSISGTNITLQQPALSLARGGIDSNGTKPVSYMENVFELLNTPGEFYLNRSTNTVYYIPRPMENMATAVVHVPALNSELINLTGTLDAPVHNIQFQGLTFTLANWLIPSTNVGLVFWQANQQLYTTQELNDDGPFHFIDAAVNLDAAQSILFERDTFTKLGGAGINLKDGSQNDTINGCTFYDIAASAIQIGEVSNQPASAHSFDHPSDNRSILKNNQVTNSYIHSVAIDYTGGLGIFAGYTANTTIAHNAISDLPYSGISIGWGWGYSQVDGDPSNPTPAKNNLIQSNDIQSVMEYAGDDGGEVYRLGSQPNSTESYDYLHHNDLDATAMYNDEGSAYWTEDNNVVDSPGGFSYAAFSPGSHDITVSNTYTNINATYNNLGANRVVTNTTLVTNGNWPQTALNTMSSAGPISAYRDLLPAALVPITNGTTLDDTDGSISYTGSWNQDSNSGYYNGTATTSNNSGDSFQFTFTGTKAQIYAAQSKDAGRMDMYVDGNYTRTVDLFNRVNNYSALVYDTGALSSGTHTIKGVVSNLGNPWASGTWVRIDKVVLSGASGGTPTPTPTPTPTSTPNPTPTPTSTPNPTPTPTGTTTTWNDNNSAITYSGNWSDDHDPSYYNGDAHAVDSAGAYYQFTFTGTKAQIYGTNDNYGGKAHVYVDGTLISTIDTYHSLPRQFQTLQFDTGTLTSGSHTIKIVVDGTSDSTSLGTWINFDKIVLSTV